MQETMLNFRWDLFSSQFASTLDVCYVRKYFVDLSLVCKDGTTIKCHKMVVANSSAFFRRLLVENDNPHPMIVLHDIDAQDLQTLVTFMYTGEIEVGKSEVRRLLKIAEILQITGLRDVRSSAQFQTTYAAELAPFPSEKSPEEAKILKTTETSPSIPSKPHHNRRKVHETPRHAEPERIHYSAKVHTKPMAATLSPNSTSSPDLNDNRNRPASNGDSRESLGSDKNLQKRHAPDHFQYLKKLRLLGEIDIIQCYDNCEVSGAQRMANIEAPTVPDPPEHHGVVIKNEIDIPFDLDHSGIRGNFGHIIQKTSDSLGGMEIFKAQPYGNNAQCSPLEYMEPIPSTSKMQSQPQIQEFSCSKGSF
ncbi:protein abrupt-like [Diachasmimorpha longicaudata]|uniref:protein abrupt-like n=1 Tax=Diachasmimorpha longicaudata TaxID=58733 RepID=UPI0030B912CD